MKKILLSAMAFVATMSMNAQVFQVNGSEHGLSGDLAPVAAGYAWGSIDGAIDISNPFATDHKVVDCKNNDFNKVVIDGNEILTKDGVQGNDNPKDADGTGVGASLKEPTSGAVIEINAKKDGWVYIVSKLSSNKQYVVFEEGSPMGYKIAMENATEDVINIEVKGEGEYNYLDPAKFEGGLPWVIRIFKDNNEAESAGNGLGVFYFPVAADCKYYASASGSKISWSGIYFSETEAQSITVEGEGISKTLVGGGDTPAPQPAGDVVSLIDKFTGCWNGAETATANADGSITYAAKQWGGLAAWLAGETPADYSAYDNIVFEFAEPTPCAVQGFVQYGDQSDNKTWVEAGTTKAVCALGDGKAAINQIALQCAEDATLTITKIYLEKAGETAIQSTKAQAKAGIRYNLAGQKVDANYKGIVIENGKKFMVK